MSFEVEADPNKRMQKKLKDIFEATIDRGLKFEGSLTEMNYFNIAGKAASNDMLFNISSNTICMYNFDYENSESILMLFSIPINTSNEKERHISERIMDIIKNTEECFTTLDYVNSKELKDEKFVYIIMVKKLSRIEEDLI